MANNNKNNNNDLTIVNVKGSTPLASGTGGANPINCPTNVLSHSSLEHFATFGIGSFVDIELKEKAKFNTISIGFVRGDERKTKFTVSKTDEDFKKFEALEPCVFVSSGLTQSPQKFHIKQTEAKALRLSFDGNIDNSHFVSNNVINPAFLSSANNNSQLITSTATTNATTDVGPNKQIFSINSISLLNEDLDEGENQKLDEILKEIQEFKKYVKKQNKDKDEDNNSCCHCGGKVDDESNVCESCGKTGIYNNVTYNYVVNQFPVTFDNSTNKFVSVKSIDNSEQSENQEENVKIVKKNDSDNDIVDLPKQVTEEQSKQDNKSSSSSSSSASTSSNTSAAATTNQTKKDDTTKVKSSAKENNNESLTRGNNQNERNQNQNTGIVDQETIKKASEATADKDKNKDKDNKSTLTLEGKTDINLKKPVEGNSNNFSSFTPSTSNKTKDNKDGKDKK